VARVVPLTARSARVDLDDGDAARELGEALLEGLRKRLRVGWLRGGWPLGNSRAVVHVVLMVVGALLIFKGVKDLIL